MHKDFYKLPLHKRVLCVSIWNTSHGYQRSNVFIRAILVMKKWLFGYDS